MFLIKQFTDYNDFIDYNILYFWQCWWTLHPYITPHTRDEYQSNTLSRKPSWNFNRFLSLLEETNLFLLRGFLNYFLLCVCHFVFIYHMIRTLHRFIYLDDETYPIQDWGPPLHCNALEHSQHGKHNIVERCDTIIGTIPFFKTNGNTVGTNIGPRRSR